MTLSRQDVSQALQPYVFFTMAGMIGLFAVIYWAYPLLDSTNFLFIGIALLFGPLLFIYPRYGFGKPLSASELPVAKKAYIWAGVAIWSLLVLVICNGGLDRSVTPTEAVVIARQITQGRHSKTYSLIVESWRPGRDTEELRVNTAIYQAAVPNQTVTVDVHKGFFGWPWYDNVRIRSFRGLLGAPPEE